MEWYLICDQPFAYRILLRNYHSIQLYSFIIENVSSISHGIKLYIPGISFKYHFEPVVE